MIHGIVRNGAILPLDPIPADWDGRQVAIETEAQAAPEECAEIEKWYADLEALGPAQYEAGEREAIERIMAEADRDAKEYMKRTWARFDDVIPAGHEPPERGTER